LPLSQSVNFYITALSVNIKHNICRAIVLSVALYGREILYLLISEDRLRDLRKISGPKREEVTGDWRKLYNNECHDV
jgi:hypothetical protein